jgi:hypothetical protein
VDHLLARGDSTAILSRPHRLARFHHTAVAAVSDHPVTEIAAVCDHVFGVCGGDLPTVIIRDLDAYIPPWRQAELRAAGTRLPLPEWMTPRVTNLHQITHRSHYPQLLGLIGRSPPRKAPP